MSDSKSFEKKLDRDFLFYLNLTKSLYQNVKDEDKQACEVWLTYLFGKSFETLAEKCDRNIYLSRLLLQIQNGKLTGVFLETPPEGALPCAFMTFTLPTEVDGLRGFEEMGFQIDSSTGGGSGDFFEASRDGRTYVATRHLAQGMMAYLAVTNNEGEPAWIPQTCPSVGFDTSESRMSEVKEGRYVKRLLDYIEAPLCSLRKSPEERDKLLEWMDKIINDCNKWLQGEDPHNAELEQLFEQLYEDYHQDPENCELLNHPRTLRNILFKDIRDKIAERRLEVVQREMILDKYESDQYTEVRESDVYIDEVWLEYARKPIADVSRRLLEYVYPPEVVKRFGELLFQEKLTVIEKGERQAKKKIAELRKASIEDTARELQKLQKAKDDYKAYYCIYKEVEEALGEFEKERKAKFGKSGKIDQQNIDKFKQEMEFEVTQAKRTFDKERRTQHDLLEKLEATKDAYRKMQRKMALEVEKLNCDSASLQAQKEEIQMQISNLKREILRNKLACRRLK